MPALDVTIVQADLVWHDAERNRAEFAAVLERMDRPSDVIVLPEMFTTGFTMDAPDLAEAMGGPSLEWLAVMAARRDSAICGSLIIREADRYYNRLIFMRPDGSYDTYDKRHLFRLADEHKHYLPGNRRLVLEWRGWRLCPLVCYDLRFPVWSRNDAAAPFDLLLYVANWPDRRHLAWETLLRARAIENLCYVAGVNRVGTDGNGLPHAGGSAVIDYLGQDLVELGDQPGSDTATLDRDQLLKFRAKFPFDADADAFRIDADRQ